MNVLSWGAGLGVAYYNMRLLALAAPYSRATNLGELCVLVSPLPQELNSACTVL